MKKRARADDSVKMVKNVMWHLSRHVFAFTGVPLKEANTASGNFLTKERQARGSRVRDKFLGAYGMDGVHDVPNRWASCRANVFCQQSCQGMKVLLGVPMLREVQ